MNGTVEVSDVAEADGPGQAAARSAIVECMRRSCGVPLGEALALQAKLAADFLASPACRAGRVGSEAARTLVA